MSSASAIVPGKIGVVTVTYNSAEVLALFLASVAAQTCTNFLLYAVDNQSHDTTVTQLQAWTDARLRLIANPDNRGIAEGNNQGIRAALADGCDYILLLNNDVEFPPETFAALLDEMTLHCCDLIAPKIYYEDGRYVWSAGGGFSHAKGYLGFHTGEGRLDTGQFESVRRIEHSPACCLLIAKDVFTKIGLVDPKYFVYQDDTDFSFRAMRAGLTMLYTPRAVVFHKVSSLTGGSKSDFTMRFNTRGHVYFMLKNLGWLRCCFYLPAWWAHLVFKRLRGQISAREFDIRRRAFFEGWQLWKS